MSAFPEYISFLQDPASYSHMVESVELLQTHISYVTLAGDYAYKWKKPVNFGFLDFETLEKRKHFCIEELRLNRRLCPTLYLELVAVVQTEHGLQLGLEEDGKVVEYGIKMTRMNQELLMNNQLEAGNVNTKYLDNIIEKLVPFYKTAENSPELDVFGTAKGFGVNVIENFEQTESFVGGAALSQESFDTLKKFSLNFLSREDVFDARISSGKIRDCHGDMYSANICLEEDVQIFDCIEFNERFRYSDIAADIAFLAMDLDYHGRSDLADYFVTAYVTKSGDETLLEVLNFYKIYRAYVRAKIALFTSSDPAVPKDVAESCVATAAKYFTLALGYCK